MSSEGFVPVRGTIERVGYTHSGVFAFVTERDGAIGFVRLYKKSMNCWYLRGSYQLGFLQLYLDEFLPLYGVVSDIGISVDDEEDSYLVVEYADGDLWYLLYDKGLEEFWDLEEFFVVGDK